MPDRSDAVSVSEHGLHFAVAVLAVAVGAVQRRRCYRATASALVLLWWLGQRGQRRRGTLTGRRRSGGSAVAVVWTSLGLTGPIRAVLAL